MSRQAQAVSRADQMTGALPGVLLAAGLSRRMGCCKLTLPLGGRPLFDHALEAALGGGLNPLVVVAGPHSPPEIAERAAFFDRAEPPAGAARVYFCLAERAAEGQAESLKAGLARVLELVPGAPGVMALLGDQPLVSADLVRGLTEEFFSAAASGEAACVAPAFDGRRGNPVILHRDLFKRVFRLQGDQGARSLLASFPLRLVAWKDDSCLADVDTPENYDRIALRFPR